MIGCLFCVAALPSETGSKHKVAYRCYRKRTGEQGLLERKQKLKRVSATLDLYSKKELREANKSHYQHLVKLHQQLRPTHTSVCGTVGCTQVAMPFASKCSKRILHNTYMYTVHYFSTTASHFIL